ncbi:anti-sigma factor family protein [Singulisphaera sp. GP187]|uniref:anti-sigma factor family protein n=1 Tax=Singulisphaera sp. GP187 TaxID=1882752 RepID=UPI0020B12B64|nr:hypothetical protein [Singulisphaera sp. GP187]
MKTEDEIFLSAYLDGELDPEQRSSVESALLANPALAERLRQLTVVRDLVANLPRLALHEDLASAIVARTRSQGRGSLVSRLRRLPIVRIGLAAAALAVLSVGLGLLTGRARPTPATSAPAHQPMAVATTRPAKVDSTLHRPLEAVPSSTSVVSRSDAPTVSPRHRLVGSERNETELQTDREQTRIRQLLDSPDLKHVFVVVDEFGGDMPGRVEGLVRGIPRLDPLFGKITVSQGIVIDPKHPNQATVFALVMDQDEVEQFRNRLKLDFPAEFEEIVPDPMVVTQLSGIGQVAVSTGARATALSPPPAKEDLKSAIRARALPKNQAVVYRRSPEFDGIPVPEVSPRPPVSSDDLADAKPANERDATGLQTSTAKSMDSTESLTVAQAGAATVTSPENSANLEARDKARQRPTSVVLVWVTTRDPVQTGRR